jgi:hypothetical protein
MRHLFVNSTRSLLFCFSGTAIEILLARNQLECLNPESPDSTRKEDTYMKTKALYPMITALALSISVQAVSSEISVSTADNSRFVLTVDNYYFGTPSSTFNVSNLSAGYHRVKMMRQGVLVNGRSVPMEVVYDGYVNVPADARVVAVSPASGMLNITSIVSLFTGGNPYGGGWGTPGNGGWGYDPWGGNNTPDYGYGNGGYNNGGYGNNGWFPPVPQGMSQTDFDALKATIARQGFESNKQSITMQALQSNKVTARQVKELMSLMSYESTKLEIAKAAYAKTIDRQNYYIVNEAFGYSSSSDELARFINGYQG